MIDFFKVCEDAIDQMTGSSAGLLLPTGNQIKLSVDTCLEVFFGFSFDGNTRLTFKSKAVPPTMESTSFLQVVQGSENQDTYWTSFDLLNDDLRTTYYHFCGNLLQSVLGVNRNEAEAFDYIKRTFSSWRKKFQKASESAVSREKTIGIVKEPLLYSTESFIDAMNVAWTSRKRHIVITGDGGAGKSYFLMDVFCRLCEHQEIIPLYFDLTTFGKDESIKNRIITDYCGAIKTDTSNLRNVFSVEHPLPKPSFVFCIDGISETDNPSIFIREIKQLLYEYNCIQIVLSARSFFWQLSDQFCEMSPTPLTDEQIDSALNRADIHPSKSLIPDGLMNLLRRPLFLFMYLKDWKDRPLDEKEKVINTAGEFFEGHYKRLIDKAQPDQEERTEFALRYLFPSIAGNLHREFEFGEGCDFNETFDQMQPIVFKRYSACQRANSFENDPAGLIALLINSGVLIETVVRKRYRFRHAYHYEYLRAKYISNEMERTVSKQNISSRNQWPHQAGKSSQLSSPEGTILSSADWYEDLKLLLHNKSIMQDQQELFDRFHDVAVEMLKRNFGDAIARISGRFNLEEKVPETLYTRMPTDMIRWVGEILQEHKVSGGKSVVEVFMHLCSGVALGNCIEILKTSRHNTIKANFDNLKITNARLSGVDLRGSSFRRATINQQSFLPVEYSHNLYELGHQPLLSPDGKYFVIPYNGQMQFFILNDYLPFMVPDQLKCCHFTKDNRLIYWGNLGIIAFSYSNLHEQFRILSFQPKNAKIKDIYACNNYLAILFQDELQIIDVVTHKTLINHSDSTLITASQFVALHESPLGELKIVLVSSQRELWVGSAVFEENRIDSWSNIIWPGLAGHVGFGPFETYVRFEDAQDSLLIEIGMLQKVILAEVYLLSFSNLTLMRISGKYESVSGYTVHFDQKTGYFSYITQKDTSHLLKIVTLQGQEVASEQIQSSTIPLASNGEICISLDSKVGSLSVYSLQQQRVLFSITDPDYCFDDRSTVKITPTKVAFLFQSGRPCCCFALKVFNRIDRRISFTDFHGAIFESVGISQIDKDGTVEIMGIAFDETHNYPLRHAKIPTNGDSWNGVWERFDIDNEDDSVFSNELQNTSSSVAFQNELSQISDAKHGNGTRISTFFSWWKTKSIFSRAFILKKLLLELPEKQLDISISQASSDSRKDFALSLFSSIIISKTADSFLFAWDNNLFYCVNRRPVEFFMLDSEFKKPREDYYTWIGPSFVILLDCSDRTLTIWDIKNRNRIAKINTGKYDKLFGASETDGSKILIKTGGDITRANYIVVYPRQASEAAAVYQLDGFASEDGTVVLLRNRDVLLFNYYTGEIIERIVPLPGRVEECDFREAIIDDELKRILNNNGAVVD